MRQALELGFAALLVFATVAGGQTVIERAQEDELALVPKDDPAMTRAYAKARETLDQFLALAKDPPGYVRSAAVKVAIGEGAKVEFFWLSPFTRKGDRLSGLITNEPRLVKHVKSGHAFEFSKFQIVDWMYVDSRSNKMVGNFTACALLTREPPEQAAAFRRQYGLECEP